MKLNEGIIGRTYRVESVAVNETITRRLEALGVNNMTPVTLLNKKGSGSVIFKVRGTRLAVGKRISDGIEISEMEVQNKEREKHADGAGTGTGGRYEAGKEANRTEPAGNPSRLCGQPELWKNNPV